MDIFKDLLTNKPHDLIPENKNALFKAFARHKNVLHTKNKVAPPLPTLTPLTS